MQCVNNLKQIALATLAMKSSGRPCPAAASSSESRPRAAFTTRRGFPTFREECFSSCFPTWSSGPSSTRGITSEHFHRDQRHGLGDRHHHPLVSERLRHERSPDRARRQLLRPRTIPDVLHQLCRQLRDLAHGVESAVQRPAERALQLRGAVRTASVTDGLSNTIAFGEHARAVLAPADQLCDHWWASGYLSDTLLTTLYPMNPQKSTHDPRRLRARVLAGGIEPAPGRLQLRVPGWLGPVPQGDDRLLEDRPGHRVAAGVSFDSTGLVHVAPLTRFGVYQALSTRNGGEVIDSSSY